MDSSEGRTLPGSLRTSLSGSDAIPPHEHGVMVDEDGNGTTTPIHTFEVTHSHTIRNWQVQPASGHSHTLQGLPAMAMRATGGRSPCGEPIEPKPFVQS